MPICICKEKIIIKNTFFFFKTKNCSNNDPFIRCNYRIEKILHNMCISAVAISLVTKPCLVGVLFIKVINSVANHDICLDSFHVLIKMNKGQFLTTGLGGSVGCASDWRPGGRGFDPRRDRQHSFVEIDHEIFCTVILSLLLIQEGQLSVSGEGMCTILVNHPED